MSTNMMSAIVAHDYGNSDALTLESVVRPEVSPDTVLIKIAFAGVNPIDWKLRSGIYKTFMPLTFPWIPGTEASGIVEDVGSNVIGFVRGQEVYGPMLKAYAQYSLAKPEDIRIKPSFISFEAAAGISLGALTAWALVVDAGNIQKGQRVLIHGAAGGVGMYAVQLAVWKGAMVIGSTSSHNVDFVHSLGASEVLDYKQEPFEKLLHGIDVVIDTVGGDLVERSLKVIKKGGIFTTVVGMPSPDRGKEFGIQVISTNRAPSFNLSEINSLVESKTLRPEVGRVFQLKEAKQANDLCQTGHGRGRIVLQVSP